MESISIGSSNGATTIPVSRRRSGLDCLIHVRDQITRALLTKGKRNRRSISADRKHTHSGAHGLKFSTARNRCSRRFNPLESIAAEGRNKAAYESFEIIGLEIDVSRVVLRPYGNGVLAGPSNRNSRDLSYHRMKDNNTITAPQSGRNAVPRNPSRTISGAFQTR